MPRTTCHTLSVTSPSDGVVGSIPYRVGSLVSPSVASPLTTVADISEMYAYFSMTERQLLSQIREGGSIKEILEKMPDVQLQLIDGTCMPTVAAWRQSAESLTKLPVR